MNLYIKYPLNFTFLCSYKSALILLGDKAHRHFLELMEQIIILCKAL